MSPVASRILRTRPQQATNAGVHIPAPVGGINAASPASMMPPTDCLYLYNMIPFQYGLRVRSGWKEWCTNLGSADPGTIYDDGSPLAFTLPAGLGGPHTGSGGGFSAGEVRSILSFTGSASDGATDRLFACTREGIWDVTHSSDAPTLVYTFPDLGISAGNFHAGRGVATSFVNSGGEHFLAYCDGAFGYLLYRESTDAWTAITLGSTPGTQIESWDPTNQPVDPASFRFVMQWKNRLWFIPDDSTTAWYLDIGAFAGTAYPMPFAPRFRYGGALVGLWSWTVDGGQGIDDHLVAISRGGDVVIYSGTDPALPGAFTLRGVWWVGAVPPGRNIASDFGGDIFILSTAGCLPLSKLVAGGMIRDPNIFETAKMSNLFNRYMTERGTKTGWGIRIHPTDNTLVITYPATPNDPTGQFVMSLATKGWAQHLGIPMTCMESWHGRLFFGTTDGRVCMNDGFVDGLTLDASRSSAIDWSLLTAYQSLGSTRKKRLHMVRPLFMTDANVPGYSIGARWDFDLTGIDTGATTPTPVLSAWDHAFWDFGLWGPSIGIAGQYEGSTGIGSHVAVALRGSSESNVTLVAFDALLSQGGFL